MKDSYIVYKGNRIDFTEEQIKLFGLDEEKEVKNNVFERIDYNGNYYFIASNGSVKITKDKHMDIDDGKYNVANYCLDEEIMKKRAKEEVLNRLLWRFSMENGWDDELWKKNGVYKYSIYYNYYDKKYRVDDVFCCMDLNTAYFVSEEIAQRAIDEIVIPFEKGELESCKILE